MSVVQGEISNAAILLRPYRAPDALALYQAVDESRSELGQWLSWVHPDYTLQDSVQFLDTRNAALANEEEYGFAIFERGSGRLVGGCGINQIEKAALRANLGYWMRSSATRRGYATQAVRLLARWAFEKLSLERIEIVAALGNLASQRVATKAGATREGVARRRLRVHGVQHDAVVFSLIPDDLVGERP
jgi:ribosomal-protein-serine acetyltransferase